MSKYFLSFLGLIALCLPFGEIPVQAATEDSEIRAHAVALQVLVETYAEDHKEKTYPESLADLYQAVIKWKWGETMQQVTAGKKQTPVWLMPKLPVVFVDWSQLSELPLQTEVMQMLPGSHTAGYVLYQRTTADCYLIHRLQANGKPYLSKGLPLIYGNCE